MKIAISLITCSDINLLKPCINSLLKSDIKNYDFKIFCIDNDSKDNTVDFINSLDCPIYLKKNTKNEGIVKPRIEIMNKILEENYDLTLEIHSDMLFPTKFIYDLISEIDNDTAIVEPYILNNPNKILSNEELEKLVLKYKDNIIVENVRQVHPWLLNNKIIKKIGYYDINYSPCECEDDDLIYNIIKNNYKIKAIKKSIVAHYGGMTRFNLNSDNKLLITDKLQKNLEYFKNKHGITVNDMVKNFKLHPIITNY